MNKVLVAVLVIALGGLAGWYFLQGNGLQSGGLVQPQPTAEVTQTPQESYVPSSGESGAAAGTKGGSPVVATAVTVTLTDSGFTPAKVTIKKGTKVVFQNESSANMWVESDVHPTHQLLPGFDAKKGLANGAMYEYTFAKVGTWTYHNHLMPTLVGAVVVTE